MSSDLMFQIALTQVPFVGHVHAKTLSLHFGSAQAIFSAKRSVLESIEGIGEIRARSIKQFSAFKAAEKEMLFIEKYKIEPLFISSDKYPRRLLNCYDPPTLLYYKGSANLNAPRYIAVVGTRNNTLYGKSITEKIIRELIACNVTIVSGLAYGIDSIAHKCCIQNNIPTIGVLAHGLDTIYPVENSPLAKLMIGNGGLLTEFRSNTKPDKHNFPSRNRIVAGLCDATIVIETGTKGGSIITGELANSYNRDVFAVPGRITDNKSSGCNYLIKSNKAILLSGVADLIESLGWNEAGQQQRSRQRRLFVELTAEEQKLYDLLSGKESESIDELNISSGLSASVLCSVLLSLEFKNLITSLPGKMYKLIG